MNFIFVEASRQLWGTEQFQLELATGCHQAGHRVVGVMRKGSPAAIAMRSRGIEVLESPFRGGGDPRAMLQVWRTARSMRQGWLVTSHQKHFWPLWGMAKLTGFRLAAFRHMGYINSDFTRRRFPALADRFYAVSRYARSVLVEKGAPAASVRILHNPIDTARFVPSDEVRQACRLLLNIPADSTLAGFVGRHDNSKGVHELRVAVDRAMARLPDLHMVWVGEGPELTVTREYVSASAHAARHRFVRFTERPEAVYPAMDVLLVPSEIPETFGRVMVEAQACGVPVLARERGGLPEACVPGETGIMWASGCTEKLGRKIEALLSDRERLERMRREGRNFALQFDRARITERFIADLVADGVQREIQARDDRATDAA